MADIAKPILTATTSTGSVLAVMVDKDGTLAIFENGVFLAPLQWKTGDLPACIAEFARLAGLAGPHDQD